MRVSAICARPCPARHCSTEDRAPEYSGLVRCDRARGDVMANGGAKQLDVRFAWRGEAGMVHVECIPNTDPDSYGCWWSVAQGFPVCTATVDYPDRGYHSMFGWVQVVRSTDNESGGVRFEVDPFGLFGDTPSPYCWYGQRPILFDAPSCSVREPLEWVAHSFLATTPLNEVAEKSSACRASCGVLVGLHRDDQQRDLSNIEVLRDHAWRDASRGPSPGSTRCGSSRRAPRGSAAPSHRSA